MVRQVACISDLLICDMGGEELVSGSPDLRLGILHNIPKHTARHDILQHDHDCCEHFFIVRRNTRKCCYSADNTEAGRDTC